MNKRHAFVVGLALLLLGLVAWLLLPPKSTVPPSTAKAAEPASSQESPTTSAPSATGTPAPSRNTAATTPNGAVSATNHDSHQKHGNLDLRRATIAGPNSRQQTALTELRRQVPGADVQFDPVTGAPSHVMATGRFLTPPRSQQNAAATVGSFVDSHTALFGHDSSALQKARITRDDVTAHNGLRTVVWQQQVDGIPVYNTILKANVAKTGEIIAIGSHFVSEPEAATQLPEPVRQGLAGKPPVSVTQAVSLAAANLGDTVEPATALPVTDPQGAERMQKFDAPGLSDTNARLAWMPMSADTLRLAWDVTLTSLAQNEMFRIVVDAQTGAVLMRTSLTNDATDASFRVYADPATKRPFDSPNPMLPGTPTPSGAQAVEVPRNLITLQSLDATASPNGWINTGVTETLGNNVDAHTDTDANNIADLPRPNGGGSRMFDYPVDLTLAPSNYKDGSAVHLFYMCNWMHDKLYALGFTESAGNFQTDNFGRGGLGNDAVQADSQDGSGTNNANMSTPTDGSAPRMQMYVFTGPTPDRDGDFDNVVVLHEYTHGLSNRLVGGGVGISATQTGGMGEGWSDFYGLALLVDADADPNAVYPGGSYATYQINGTLDSNYYYGIRRYPYCTDMAKNPLTLKDIDPTAASPHTGVPLSPRYTVSNSNPAEVHGQGEVWCMVLWECRAQLIAKYGGAVGSQKVLQLVTDAMKLCPVNPTHLQSRDAIIQADFVNGGQDRIALWTAFAKRGYGASAIVPAANTTTGVIEAYDLPDDLTVSPVPPMTFSGTRLVGPILPATSAFTLVNTGTAPLTWTAGKTQPWLVLAQTSGNLAPGASTSVLASVNEPVAIALAAGTFTDTVTFRDGNNNAQILRTVKLTIDPYLQRAAFYSLDSDPLWSRQGEWAYGTPTGAPVIYGARDPVAGFTGTKVFGINLNGAYTATSQPVAYLTTSAINTLGMTGVTLRFKRWLGADYQPYTAQSIDVSNDGVTWTNVFVNSTSTINDGAWTTQTYSLGSLADNRPTVYVRWGHRALSGAFPMCGWNIDDIEILAGSNTPSLTATSQYLTTPFGTPAGVTLSGSDSANPGAGLTYTVSGAPNNGTLSGTAPNLTYTPNPGFYGVDSFNFTVTSAGATSTPASISIFVQPGVQDIAVEQPLGNNLTDGSSTVAFGNVPPNASLTKQFVIKNLGNGPLTLGTVSIDGPNASEFTTGSPSTSSLSPGALAYFNVTFSPRFQNGKTATLHVASDDADETSFEIALTGTSSALGAAITLVKDLNPLPAGTSPATMTVVGSQAFFTAITLDAGAELWRTDGTSAGTYLVKDIFSGSTSSNPASIVAFNNKAYFVANTTANGNEVWMSDGTDTGTTLLKDIASLSLSSNPASLTVIGSKLFFTANDGTNGIELWVSDGTSTGTMLLKDINPGVGSSSPANLVNVNGTAFFSANDGTTGVELWMSDGTAAGTVRVKDIVAGLTNSSPSALTSVGSRLFFVVNDLVNGAELWTSDGTDAGTVLVKDINSGANSSSPTSLYAFDQTLYFAATDGTTGVELWKSDGTTAGTVQVKDIATGATSSSPGNFATMGGVLYFAAFDSTKGRELWKTDGTSAGTAMVRDIATNSLSSQPQSLTAIGSTLYFAAIGDGGTNQELWKSDGTTAGTMQVKDINVGSSGASPSSFANLGGILVFAANDGINGQEPWRSNGTEVGTFMLADGQPGSTTSTPANLHNVNGTLYFTANDGSTGIELWKTNGTAATTAQVKDIFSGLNSSSPSNFATINGVQYFSAFDSNGSELWKSDGTTTGTVMVKDIATGSTSATPTLLTAVGTTLFFSATDTSTTGAELWKSDGTNSGTVLVKDINPTANTGSSIANPISFNGMLIFAANDGTNGQELWKSDGTTAGTVLLKDINAGSAGSSPGNFRIVGSLLFFTAATSAAGTELWVTDGTTAGTTMVLDISTGSTGSVPSNLTAVGNTLIFTATTSTAGTELWKSDGTPAGTSLVADIVAGASSSSPGSFVVIGSTAYFAALATASGRELWKTDGTTAGTSLVADIVPGAAGASPFNLVNHNGTLYFAATTAAAGNELWKSDGTSAGTVQVLDLVTGSTSSGPSNLTSAGTQLFFTARGPNTGSSEVFCLETTPPADIAVEQPAGTNLTDGSSTVDWGNVNAGGTPVTRSFVIRNTGGLPLTLTSQSIDGANATEFSTTPNYIATTIAPGSNLTLLVTCTPVGSGSKSAALHLGSDDPDENPFDINLTATSLLAPEIAIEQPVGTDRADGSSTIAVGDAQIGSLVSKSILIRNAGTAPLTLGSITIDGANPGEFATTAPTASSIAAGGTATFDVIFTPSNFGARYAALHLISNDGNESPFDLLLVGIGSAPAGPARVVRDINQTGAALGLTTANTAVIGSSFYFAGFTPETGTELWKTDGTSAGTVLIKDIATGPTNGGPTNFCIIGSTLYFTAFDSTNGTELWKSDGTAAGTVLVKDIYSGNSSSSPAQLVNANGTLFFVASDVTNGQELWKSDGTAAGTVLVKDIYSGSTNSSISQLTALGSSVVFSANDPTNGQEIWKSDGTTAGTVLLKDINAGVSSSTPSSITVVGSIVFFAATDSTTGTELWKTDGTSAGTVQVADIVSGTSSSSPSGLVNASGTLFFRASTAAAGSELWKSDGTTGGTVLVKDILPGSGSSSPSSLVASGTSIFFTATDGVNGTELWKSDGTASGTVMVADLVAGSGSSFPANLAVINGTLYFSAPFGSNGAELWKSDGTLAGTVPIADINPGTAASTPSLFVGFGSSVIFLANDGTSGAELWKTDGSAAGTSLIRDISPGTNPSSPSLLRVLNGSLFFNASDGLTGSELWTAGNTGATQVLDIAPGATSSSPGSMVVVETLASDTAPAKSTLFFSAFTTASGIELWSTDGTTAGTAIVKDIVSGVNSSSPTSLTNVSGRLFFVATDPTVGTELWTSDGTATGTTLVKDIAVGTGSASISNLTAVGSTLFFTANDGVNGTELWQSDGSASGTGMVKNLTAGAGSTTFSTGTFANVGGRLFFAANDGSSAGSELWVSDGSAAGTYMVKDINPAGGSAINSLANFNGVAFFSATDGTNGNELWRSDGTVSGTYMVKDINAGVSTSSPSLLTAIGNTLYFAAADGSNGAELWKSDGTTLGTVMVRDIFFGSNGSAPNSLTNVNGVLYFAAVGSSTQGIELWRSDGTRNGTVLAADLRPGPSLSSAPSNLTVIGNVLYFTATGSDTGTELWSLDLTTSPVVTIFDGTGTGGPSRQNNVGAFDFGTVTTATTRTFTVTNTTDTNLYVSDIVTSGVSLGNFFVSARPDPSQPIPKGATATFSVTALPLGYGPQMGAVTVLTNDSTTGAFRINLTSSVPDLTAPSIRAPLLYYIGQPGTFSMPLPDLRSIVVYQDENGGSGTIVQTPAPGSSTISVSQSVTVTFSAMDAAGNPSNSVSTQVIMGVGQVNDGSLAYAGSGSGTGTDASTTTLTTTRVAAMPDGGFVVAGQFVSTGFTLGSGANAVTLTSNGSNDVFLARYRADGTLLWARKGGGTSSDTINALVVLSDGSIAAAGTCVTSITFDGTTATASFAGTTATYLVRYLADSTLAWLRCIGGGGSLTVTGLTELAGGNIVAVGGNVAISSVNFGSGISLPNIQGAGTDLWVAKFSTASGVTLWANSLGGSLSEPTAGVSVASLPDGGLAMVGIFQSSVLGFSNDPRTLTNSASGSTDFVVAKYDENGTLVWARNPGGSSSESLTQVAGGQSLVVLPNNDVVLAGTTISLSATFGAGEANQTTLANFNTVSTSDIVVADFAGVDGTLRWAKHLGSIGSDVLGGVASLPDGSVAITGTYASSVGQFGMGESRQTLLNGSSAVAEIFVARLSGDTGNLVWAKSAGGGLAETVTQTIALRDGDIGVAGTFLSSSATFGLSEAGQTTLTNASSNADLFIAKFSLADGSLQWAKRAGGAGNETAQGLTMLRNNSALLVGSFQAPDITLGASEANAVTLPNAESTGTGTDLYIARFNAGGVAPPGAPLVNALAATGLSSSTFTFNTSVDSQGADTTVVVEYGPTTSYGSAVTLTPVAAGVAPEVRSLTLTGLTPFSATHLRVTATNVVGTTVGPDQTITTYTDAEIAVEESGTDLIDGASLVSYGHVALGNPIVRTFTIRNASSTGTLLNLTRTIDGSAAADFVASTLAVTSLAPGASTALTVTFTPSQAGNRTAALHIGSNDGDEPSFDIALSGDNFLTAAFMNPTDVPISSDGYTVQAGINLNLALSFAPAAGTTLRVLENTSSGPIVGSFDGLPQFGLISTAFGGVQYLFQADYTGGDGNDLVLGETLRWTWIKGSNLTSNFGTFGTQGTPTGTNTPSARYGAGTWTDAAGNFWMFGGNGFSGSGAGGYLNDLWKYNAANKQWVWLKGSGTTANLASTYGSLGVAAAANTPGGRYESTTWIDASGILWLFGGFGSTAGGVSAYLNDLWKYDPATNNWTWVGGGTTGNSNGVYGTQGTPSASNFPGSRFDSAAWTDPAGNLWLFGGSGFGATGTGAANLNDLWKYNPTTAQWTWIKGSTTTSSLGVYGTKGTEAATNTPGARVGAAVWKDEQNRIWLFGGSGFTSSASGFLADLWRFDTTTNGWTWVGGPNAVNPISSYGVNAARSALAQPGGRSNAAPWVDGRGRFWLFGGNGNGASASAGELNDLWCYDPTASQWAFVRGSTNVNVSGSYGTLDVAAATNLPGGRDRAALFSGATPGGDVWLFGGFGYATSPTTLGSLNDFWMLDLPSLPSVTTLAATALTSSSATLRASVATNGLGARVRFRYGADPGLTNAIATAVQPVEPSAIATTVSETISGLTDGATYYYQAVVDNVAGSVSGAILSFVAPAAADIAIEQPAGTPIIDGSAIVAIGTIPTGQTTSKTFTLRNAGASPLTGIAAAVDGANAAEFAITGLPSSVSAGIDATFTVTFSPTALGARSAAVHIVSNDPDESPFDITLTGTGVEGMQTWRQRWLGSSSNTGDAADTADPYHTGVPNLVAFALFGPDQNPATVSVSQIPKPQRSGGNFTVSFTEPNGVNGIIYGAEWTSTLNPPSWTAVSDSGSGTTHTFSMPIGSNTKMFMRLTVTPQ